MNRQTKNAYFTKEMVEAIDAMTEGEMKTQLMELTDTRYWVAIMKYNEQRLSYAQNALVTLDPFKNQTEMARMQGIISGITDLQDVISFLEEKAKEKETPTE